MILFVARREWLKMIFFFLIVVLLFSPWILRNYGKYGILMPFNAALGYNLWNGNHLGASGEMEINYQPLIDYAKDHTSIETHQKGIEEFKNFILHYPLGFAKITLKRISIFFSFSRPSGFWPDFTPKQQAVSAFLSLIYSVIIFTLGIAGAVLSLKNFLGEEKKKIRLFAALAICIPVSVIFILVESRYRYPLYPFLAVFGGFFVSEIISNKEKIKGLIIPFVVLFLNSILDFSLNFTRFWDKIKDIL
ncbi:MAG: hypothetical protein NTX55_02105 [Candidatus Parcubacteria bacterium]|nr:hypothetical protein [Candidatus Parcubacteria bacterium]